MKIWKIAAALAAMLLILPTAYADEHRHCSCGETECAGGEKHEKIAAEDISWQPYNGTSIEFDGNYAAHIYLTDDVTLTGGELDISLWNTKVYLCLNGHTLTSSDYSSPIIRTKGDLVICDCAGGGKIGVRGSEENPTAAAGVEVKRSFYLYGGSICDNYGKESAVYLSAGNSDNVMHMYGGSISNNTNISGNGGGIQSKTCAKMYMYDGSIRGNTAKSNGGGVCLGTSGEMHMHGGSITGNSASNGGGIYMSSGNAAELAGGSITGNSASNGGGIYLNLVHNVNVGDCNIVANSANYGGGVFIKDLYGEKVVFAGNISKNTAKTDGGAIYVEELAGTDMPYITVAGGSISSNSAVNGSAIYLKTNSVMDITDGEIIGNTASGSGTVYVNTGTALNMSGGKISDNTIGGNGGGIYAWLSEINLTGGEISGNNSVWGAGVYIHGATLVMDGGSILNNTATYSGGGLLLQNGSSTPGKATVNGGEICGNVAKTTNSADGGGGIWVTGSGSTLTLNGGKIMDNRAVSGGGICIGNKNSHLNLNGGSVTGNVAQARGGGIYVVGNMTASGGPQVIGNTINEERDDNIWLPSNRTIGIGADGLHYDENMGIPPLLGVTLADVTKDVTGKCGTDYSDCFVSDNEAYVVYYNGSVMKLGEACTVRYDYDTGYVHEERTRKGAPLAEPEDLLAPKHGYDFAGWYVDGEGYDFSKPVTGDITLTAKWVESGTTAVNVTSTRVYVSGVYPAVIFLASRTADGVVDVKRVALTETNNVKISDTGLVTDGAAEIAAYLWDGNYTPLCESSRTNLK